MHTRCRLHLDISCFLCCKCWLQPFKLFPLSADEAFVVLTKSRGAAWLGKEGRASVISEIGGLVTI